MGEGNQILSVFSALWFHLADDPHPTDLALGNRSAASLSDNSRVEQVFVHRGAI